MKNYTEIITILDRSGSMDSIRTDMEGAFNAFIAEQKKVTTDEAKVSLYTFDTTLETEYEGRPLAEVPSLNIFPRGGTALYDAVGRIVNKTGQRFAALKEDERPARVVVVIITDGEENSSREFSGSKVKELVKHQSDKYSWEFVFFGANQDAFNAAASIGVKSSNTMTFAANTRGVKSGLDSLSKNLVSYRCMAADTMEFSQKDYSDQAAAFSK